MFIGRLRASGTLAVPIVYQCTKKYPGKYPARRKSIIPNHPKSSQMVGLMSTERFDNMGPLGWVLKQQQTDDDDDERLLEDA